MKIVQTKSGKSYQLLPGTQLEIERPNLFFNDFGEQSLPIELPDTDLNRQLCGYPDLLSNKYKPLAKIECNIHDGDYFANARQAIIGSNRGNHITSSFYLNDGAFLSKIQDVTLADVFGEEIIPGVETVAQGISFCTELMKGNNPNYAIFPVIYESNDENAYDKMLNKLWYDTDKKKYVLWNAEERIIKESDETSITYPAGCFITPFIKAIYLLRRVLKHFGYELRENILTNTAPFNTMVFVNNTADTLLGGNIFVKQLVPDISCTELLELFRKKFCCEFHANEADMEIDIIFMKDLVEKQPDLDLTKYVTNTPDIEFSTYKRLVLKPQGINQYGNSDSSNEISSLHELRHKYPTAYYMEDTGEFRRTRYYGLGNETEFICVDVLPYDDGGELDTYEIEVPETLCPDIEYKMDGENTKKHAPYIGSIRFLNSKMVKLTENGDEVQEDEDHKNLSSMLLLAYWNLESGISAVFPNKMDVAGGMNARNYRYYTDWTFLEYVDLSPYSLCYNGNKGIYNQFWRGFDNLLRNALHKVTVQLYLPSAIKYKLSPFTPICIQGIKLLPDVLKYTLGGSEYPVESSFYTTLLQEPVSYGKQAEDFGKSDYYWEWKSTSSTLTKEDYIAAGGKIKDTWFYVSNEYVYPDPPTKEQYEAGGKYYNTTSYVCKREFYFDEFSMIQYVYTYQKVDWWLVPMKMSS